jgi:hypothetical protein
MQRATFIILAAITCMAAPALAKKKAKKEGKSDAGIVQQFDTNGNRQIEGDEIAALKAAFAAAAPGSALKTLDRNSNGVLDDDEITALNARAGSGAGGAKKKKKKT